MFNPDPAMIAQFEYGVNTLKMSRLDHYHFRAWVESSRRNEIKMIGIAMKCAGAPFSFSQWRKIAANLKSTETCHKYPKLEERAHNV